MFCGKCGKKIKENAKYCSCCGKKIREENNVIIQESVSENNIPQDENKYLFLNNLSQKRRDQLIYINAIKERIYQIIFGLLTVYFIYRQIELQENYKLIIYVIQYIQYTIPYLFIYYVFEETIMLLTLEKNETNKDKSKMTIVIFEVIYLLILFIVSERILNPDNLLGLVKVIAEQYFLTAILKYFMFIKVEILILMLTGVFKYYINEKIVGYIEKTCDKATNEQ